MKKINILIITIVTISILSLVKAKAYTNDELEEGIIYEKQIEFISQGYNYEINELIKNDDSYIIIGKASVSLNDDINCYPYIAYYENDEIKWYHINNLFTKGQLVSAYFKDNKIVTLGNNSNDTFISEYTIYGQLSKTKTYSYNNKFNASKIFLDGDRIFMTGEIKATTVFGRKKTNNEIFVIQLDDSYEILDFTLCGNSGDNILIDSLQYKDDIYLLVKLDGSGYYDYSKKPYTLICISKRMELNYYQELDIDNPEVLRLSDNKINIFGLNNTIIERLSFEEDYLVIFKDIIYSINNKNIITNYDIAYDKNYKLWAISCEYTQGDSRTIEYVIKNNLSEIKSLLSYNKFEGFNKKIYLINGFIVNLKKILKANKWEYEIMKISKIELKNDKCLFNGLTSTKTMENLDMNIYGTYVGNIYYTFENCTLTSTGEVYVPLKINIKNNSTYALGTKLEFNGIGNLNGKEIKSGFQIDEVGNYVLEIKGNDEVTYYNFYVKDFKEVNDNIKYQNINYKKEEPKIIENELTPYTYNNTNNYTVYMFIIILIAILTGFILSVFKRRKKYA